MSQKLYCLSCGGVTEYSLTKPKFCVNCSASFDASIAKIQPKKPVAKIELEEDDDDEEGDYEASHGRVTNLRKLDVEITMDEGDRMHRPKIGEWLESTKNMPDWLVGSDRPVKKLSKKAQASRVKELQEKLASCPRNSIGGDSSDD